MENELYSIRFSEEGKGVSENFFTDKKHLIDCVEEMRRQHPSASVYVNKAVFCFDGYLVTGDWLTSYAPLGNE